jgi:hypothetical protein
VHAGQQRIQISIGKRRTTNSKQPVKPSQRRGNDLISALFPNYGEHKNNLWQRDVDTTCERGILCPSSMDLESSWVTRRGVVKPPCPVVASVGRLGSLPSLIGLDGDTHMFSFDPPLDPCRSYSFLYPGSAALEPRRLFVTRIREVNAGRVTPFQWVVTGTDLERQAEASFRFDAMQDVRLIVQPGANTTDQSAT